MFLSLPAARGDVVCGRAGNVSSRPLPRVGQRPRWSREVDEGVTDPAQNDSHMNSPLSARDPYGTRARFRGTVETESVRDATTKKESLMSEHFERAAIRVRGRCCALGRCTKGLRAIACAESRHLPPHAGAASHLDIWQAERRS